MTDLITPLIWALVVVLTLRPPRRAGRAGFIVFLLTMTVNEFPMLFLGLIVATNAGRIGDPPTGGVGLAWAGLWLFVIIGLIWVQVRAVRARPALEAALARVLGPDWRATFPTPQTQTSSAWLAGLVPLQRRRAGVRRIRDLAYGPDKAHRLDLYQASDRAEEGPVLIYFHGGGFVQGAKSREAVHLLNQLAAHGWTCVSANYRLGESATFPNPLVDAKLVIAWVRAHAHEYGADPTRICLAGGSAGAYIAVSAAFSADEAQFQPGFEDADTSVIAAVSTYGYLGPISGNPASAPSNLMTNRVPPLLLIQGSNDTVLPIGQSERWAESLRAASAAPMVICRIPGAQHSFDLFASVRARLVADQIEAFLTWACSQG